ncbi:MAG: hypothetical protein JWP14_614 [Frankiales bacterium]|jgi:hypothetical protein|nr:hypothetical protein [Frankiales bacterium]
MWAENTWLTTTLRPAGLLDIEATERLGESLVALSTTCDLVVLDLSATAVADCALLASRMRGPSARLASEGGCLMLRGASEELVSALSVAPLAAVS